MNGIISQFVENLNEDLIQSLEDYFVEYEDEYVLHYDLSIYSIDKMNENSNFLFSDYLYLPIYSNHNKWISLNEEFNNLFKSKNYINDIIVPNLNRIGYAYRFKINSKVKNIDSDSIKKVKNNLFNRIRMQWDLDLISYDDYIIFSEKKSEEIFEHEFIINKVVNNLNNNFLNDLDEYFTEFDDAGYKLKINLWVSCDPVLDKYHFKLCKYHKISEGISSYDINGLKLINRLVNKNGIFYQIEIFSNEGENIDNNIVIKLIDRLSNIYDIKLIKSYLNNKVILKVS